MSYLPRMTRPILLFPDPRLRKPCAPVGRITPEIETLAADMLATMYAAPGVGLAAPQVGVLRRVVVIDCSEEQNELIELVNPVILESRGSQCGREGCLSLPGRQGIVTRPYFVRVQAQNRDGEPFILEAEGFLARAVCHELDHLDGELYIDRMERELTQNEIKGHVPEDDLEAVTE